MTLEEEYYVHLALSIDDLNYVWHILREIRSSGGSALVGAAFRFALVAYARPYKGSRVDEHNPRRKMHLDDRFVPPQYRALHQRLVGARDQIHAHSDLTVREARLHVAKTRSGKFVGVVQNVITGLEELGSIDSIIDLVEQTLESMYEETRRLEADLPVNA